MKPGIYAFMFCLAGTVNAGEAAPSNTLCNFQITSQYWADAACRIGDVMVGAELADGALKIKCGRPLVLCPIAASNVKVSSEVQADIRPSLQSTER